MYSLRSIILVAIFGLASTVVVAAPPTGSIKNLVTFGDSYTDVNNPGDQTRSWPSYAAQYGPFNLFPFAVSGAMCSNNVTTTKTNSVFEVQIPRYETEVANGTLKLNASETMYTLWIGTNDLGYDGLLKGHTVGGATVINTTTCALSWIEAMYKNGARNFLFQNMIPLQHTILYSPNSYPNGYWSGPRDTVEWSLFMSEMVQSGNLLAELLLQTIASSSRLTAGAHIGLFDSYGLFSDIIANPKNYLNGTAPLNVTGAVSTCVLPVNGTGANATNCFRAQGTDVDSFLWFDELHPSEQADRVVAREITAAIQGTSTRWTTWFS